MLWFSKNGLFAFRYNKTLLGDHLGKFPVPLMMNTIHFGMQAVLSNAIVFFQSRCCERSRGPTMTWRDYFFRGIAIFRTVHCLILIEKDSETSLFTMTIIFCSCANGIGDCPGYKPEQCVACFHIRDFCHDGLFI